MKKLFRYSILSLASTFLVVTSAHATSYQIFSGIDFANPAALNSVKKNEFIVGGMTLISQFKFNGTVSPNSGTPVSGIATSNTTDFLPYGRLATRLSPRFVASLDITQPYYTNIQYAPNSIVKSFATSTVIRDTNYSPKLSFQYNDRLALGIGLDANYLYNGELSFFVGANNLRNKASSWGFGYDLGIFYVLSKATFLNLSYYSQIVQHGEGDSYWGSLSSNALSADVKLPATFVANIIQMLSPQWALSGTVRYAKWNTLRYTVLQSTALQNAIPSLKNITVPDHFYNNVSAELATHYQINNQWGVCGAFDYEPNVQPTFTRNVGLPTYTRLTPAIGVDYEFIKGLKGKLIYAYVYSRPPIGMSIATASISGQERVNAHAIDLSFTYDM